MKFSLQLYGHFLYNYITILCNVFIQEYEDDPLDNSLVLCEGIRF